MVSKKNPHYVLCYYCVSFNETSLIFVQYCWMQHICMNTMFGNVGRCWVRIEFIQNGGTNIPTCPNFICFESILKPNTYLNS